MKKAFVTIFPLFSESLAYKDVGLIPRYLSTYYDYDAFIISNKGADLDEVVFGSIKQIHLGGSIEKGKVELDIARYQIIKTLRAILKISREYDKVVVNFYHGHRNTLLLSAIIKFIFPDVLIYIKLDINNDDAKVIFENKHSVMNKLKGFFWRKIDFLSAETNVAFSYLNKVDSFRNRINLIQNGVFLDEGLIDIGSADFIYKKEKIIFTAGRLDSYQKNTKLLIDSFLSSKLWEDEWQLVLAGSYDEKLQKYIEKQVSSSSIQIILTGHLNREQMFSYMRRAKVFALSSRWEGFALVLPEAVAHGCIIAATNVGGVEDVTNGGKLGFVAKEQNVEVFTEALKQAATSNAELAKQQLDFGLSIFDWKTICDKLNKVLNEKTK